MGLHDAQVGESQRDGAGNRAADLEGAVMVGDGKVAAHVMHLGGRDVAGQGCRGSLRVVGRGVDHRQCGAGRFEVLCQAHTSASLWGGVGRVWVMAQ